MPEQSQPPLDTPDQQNDDVLLQQVAEWLVKMSSEDCTDADRQAFLSWQQQHPQHKLLTEQVQATLNQFNQLQDEDSKQIIEQTLQDDSLPFAGGIYRSLVLVFCSSLIIAIMMWYVLPMNDWLADRRNGYDQWAINTLSDHSEVSISGKTAYDIEFDQQQRLIQLFNGNILVDVAKDAHRPFIVETKYARITALGTRFMVQHSKNATILTMLESKTKVELLNQHNHQATTLEVRAGQQLMIDANGSYSTVEISPELLQRAWQQHLLVVQDMPLPQVLAILQSYREIGLVYDAKQLQHITVNATLPLDQDVLDLLQKSLPIRIEQDFLGRMKVVEKN